MTVQAIRLQNFMAFADTGWIELRPITLLFGRNSSGKSAIIRALRLLRQSLDSPEGQSLCFTAEHGIDLGTFKTVLHNRAEKDEMAFHFRCHLPEVFDAIRSFVNVWRETKGLNLIAMAEAETAISLGLVFSGRGKGAILSEIHINAHFSLVDGQNLTTLFFAQRLEGDDVLETGYEWWFDTDLEPLAGCDWADTSIGHTNSFLPTLSGFSETNPPPILDFPWIISQLGRSIETFLRGIEFISPLRPEPSRVYVLNEASRSAWRQRGLGAFLEFLEDKLDAPKLEKIDEWLAHLKLAEAVAHPKKLYGDDLVAVASIRLLENRDTPELEINFSDVGYGTVQVLPIIVQTIAGRQGVPARESPDITERWIVIEQPELHLHPRAQAQLADLFVDSIYVVNPEKRDAEDRPERYPNHVNFLLETHSENLLLRFQRRVAETTLQTKKHLHYDMPLRLADFSVYFVDQLKSEKHSACEQIEINEWGEYLSQPEGFTEFFGDGFNELLNLNRAHADWEEWESRHDLTL